jgi:hypothetical protein
VLSEALQDIFRFEGFADVMLLGSLQLAQASVFVVLPFQLLLEVLGVCPEVMEVLG